MSWSDAASFDFCCDGIPPHQILTISAADLRRPRIERCCRAGMEAMVDRLKLRLPFVYGRLRIGPGCDVLEIAPDRERLRSL